MKHFVLGSPLRKFDQAIYPKTSLDDVIGNTPYPPDGETPLGWDFSLAL